MNQRRHRETPGRMFDEFRVQHDYEEQKFKSQFKLVGVFSRSVKINKKVPTIIWCFFHRVFDESKERFRASRKRMVLKKSQILLTTSTNSAEKL